MSVHYGQVTFKKMEEIGWKSRKGLDPRRHCTMLRNMNFILEAMKDSELGCDTDLYFRKFTSF